MSEHGYDEGHTVAGWAGCAVGVAAALALGAGICGWTPGFWAGLVLTPAALVTTWLLHLAGWGKAPGPRPAAEHPLTVRDTAAATGHPNCLACRSAGRSGRAAGVGRASSIPSARSGTASGPSGALVGEFEDQDRQGRAR
ncbi:hypothetical protein DSC45_06120 [Streptomyces sp. YIM 130001]|uniref:hypothetical protein n=1 Tax=Streptomyces sp. YIM 130001 TaxID=2259644 RepID=UPI000EF06B34|nr:hypothetical protein [Streptomyces sp. YIM 130001]RII19570.1 hypothetical protein DSC45_06120 [Streptomyces sp. YIM 130001]